MAVDFSGRFAAFVDGVHDQGLAAAAVAGGEHVFHAGPVLAVGGLVVAARVVGQIQRVGHGVFGAQKAHGQEHQVGGPVAFAARNVFEFAVG